MAIIVSKVWTAPGTQVGGGPVAEITTGSSEKAIVDKSLFHNTGASSETVKGYIEAAGNVPGSTHQIFEFTIPAGETRDSGHAVNVRLANSQSLYIETTTASTVNLHLSGRLIAG